MIVIFNKNHDLCCNKVSKLSESSMSTIVSHLSDTLIKKQNESDWCLFYIFGDIAWLSWSYSKRFYHSPPQWSNNKIGIVNSYSISMHITAALIMWIIGFYQFRISKQGSSSHKSFGWIYLFCAIIASITGIILSLHNKFTILSQYVLITGSIHIALRVFQGIYFIKYKKGVTNHKQFMVNQWKHTHSILFHRVICEAIQIIFIPNEPINAINYGFIVIIIADLKTNIINFFDVYLRFVILITCIVHNRFHIDHNEW